MVDNIDIVACKKSLHYIQGMDPRIVWNAESPSDINLPQDRKKVLVKHPPVDVRGDGFLW